MSEKAFKTDQKEARPVKAGFYRSAGEGMIECRLCDHFCRISDGAFGICRARQNRAGELYSLVYGRPAALAVDPIEKKPLFHFLPGSAAFSFGTLGCNFHCANCHNYEISQSDPVKTGFPFVPPEEIVEGAGRGQCRSIAYTYNEPTIFTEYALDVMRLARDRGLKNVWVSNGFMSGECLEAIVPYLDAINVDLKSMEDAFYHKVCRARVGPVLENLRTLHQAGVHLEITTLVVPTLSDNLEMLRHIAEFIAAELGPGTPWHLSRFSPEISWKLRELPATGREILAQAYELGRQAGLKYVYAGGYQENTYCPDCGELAIERIYYKARRFDREGRCRKCGANLKLEI